MKNILLFILTLLLINCSSDKNTEIEIETPIIKLKTEITSPLKKRDFTFHDNGKYGVFEDPNAQKKLSARIILEEENTASKNDFIVKWKSDKDGSLFEGKPNDKLESEIKINLSKGFHKIFFEVYTKEQKIISKDSITISNIIKLEAVSNTGRSIKLNWTKYDGNGFISYLIYREDSQYVTEITDINTLSYECLETKSLVAEQKYQVVVKTNNGNDGILGSNIISKISGDFISFQYYISKMIKDDQRSKIYALVTPSSSFNSSDKYGLLIIDTKTFKIDSHILTNDRFSDLDISPNGQYLYLAQLRVEKLTKIDLNTMSVTNFETSTNNWGFRKIESGNNDILFCHSTNPPRMLVLSATDGKQIYTNYAEFSQGDMEFNSKNEKLYLGDSNTSAGSVNSITYSNQILKIENSFPAFPNSVVYPDAFLFISDDSNSVFWENYQLGTGLQVMRVFDTKMIACSPNNLYLSNSEKVFDYNNVSSVFTYPPFPLTENTKSTLFIDDNTIITCKSHQPNTAGQPIETYFFRMKIH